MNATKIEWCDATWNPLRGCSRVSEGCRNCYAERMAARNLPGLASPTTGQSFARKTPSGPNWTGRVELIESQMEIPLHWRKPRRIFVNSISDTFHEALPDQSIGRIFGVTVAAHWHTFMILTKRASHLLDWSRSVCHYPRGNRSLRPIPGWPPNVLLGVSCENQATADERIPLLLQTPAAVRFVSLEPLLGPLEIDRYLRPHWTPRGGADSQPWLDWVIVGGESGPGARVLHPDWARSVRDQCIAAGVPFFFKQWGKFLPDSQNHSMTPEGRRLAEGTGCAIRVGKKAAGCLLDGREWKDRAAHS